MTAARGAGWLLRVAASAALAITVVHGACDRDAEGACLPTGVTCADDATWVGYDEDQALIEDVFDDDAKDIRLPPPCWITFAADSGFSGVAQFSFSAVAGILAGVIVLCMCCCACCCAPLYFGITAALATLLVASGFHGKFIALCCNRSDGSGSSSGGVQSSAAEPAAGDDTAQDLAVNGVNPLRRTGRSIELPVVVGRNDDRGSVDDELGGATPPSALRGILRAVACVVLSEPFDLILSIMVVILTVVESILFIEIGANGTQSAFGANAWQAPFPLTIMISLDLFKSLPAITPDCGGCGGYMAFYELSAFTSINLVQIIWLCQLAGEAQLPSEESARDPSTHEFLRLGSNTPVAVGWAIALCFITSVFEAAITALHVFKDCREVERDPAHPSFGKEHFRAIAAEKYACKGCCCSGAAIPTAAVACQRALRATSDEEALGEHVGAAVGAGASSGGGGDDGLSAGWVETLDPNSGHNYYTNAGTGETTWEKPAAGAVASGGGSSDDGLPDVNAHVVARKALPLRALWAMKAIAAVIDVVLALTGAVLLLFPVLPVWRHGWFAEPGSIMLRSQFPNGVPSMPSDHPRDRTLVFTDVVSAAAASGQDDGFGSPNVAKPNAVVPASADPLLSDAYALFLIFAMAGAEIVVLVWRWLIENYLRVALYNRERTSSVATSGGLSLLVVKEFLETRLACGADACESALYAVMTIVQITFLAAIAISLLLVPLLDPPGQASGVATYDQILNANVLKNQFGDPETSAAYNITRWQVGFPYYCCCYRERGLDNGELVTNNGCSAASDGDGWMSRDGAASWCTEDAFAAATVETTLYWLTTCDETSSTCSNSVKAMCAVPRGVPNGNAWDGTDRQSWGLAQVRQSCRLAPTHPLHYLKLILFPLHCNTTQMVFA